MRSNKIKDYRQIHYWENFFLDSAVYSVGQAAGFSYEEGFQIISAVTGDLFSYMYHEKKYCDSGMTNSFFLPETVKAAYAMFGYTCIYLSQEEICLDLEGAIAKICRSVDRGIPVLAWGCGGVFMRNGERYDPLPEACLIGGYEISSAEEEDAFNGTTPGLSLENKDRNLLYVNLYPGEERLAAKSACGNPGVDAYGYTAVFAEDALKTTNGIFLLGEKIAPTDMREVYRRALFSIPQLFSKQPEEGYLFGKQAFDQWAAVLTEDENWQDAKMAEENWWDKHGHAYCAICTSIGVGEGKGIAIFMQKAAEALPDEPKAKEVLPYFEKLRHFSQAIWDFQGGFVPDFEKLTEHAYRKKLAGFLMEMGETCGRILSVF